jgi:23S rRNA pseudouridine2605 synthase
MDSEGLLLLTNDGILTQRLSHPRYQHEREYQVLVHGRPGRQALRALRQGIELEDGRTSPAKVYFIEGKPGPTGTAWLRMVLREGRKRQIRRMCAAVAHPVQRLIRIRMGPLHLGDLKPGASRRLRRPEIKSLQTSVGLRPGRSKRRSH